MANGFALRALNLRIDLQAAILDEVKRSVGEGNMLLLTKYDIILRKGERALSVDLDEDIITDRGLYKLSHLDLEILVNFHDRLVNRKSYLARRTGR